MSYHAQTYFVAIEVASKKAYSFATAECCREAEISFLSIFLKDLGKTLENRRKFPVNGN